MIHFGFPKNGLLKRSAMLFILDWAKCFDVRFPELSLVLAQQGAHILAFPSAFTEVTGSAHWEVCHASKGLSTLGTFAPGTLMK